ncbi:MAG: A24 family peptidase [Rhodothermales bacterium]
MLTSLSTIELTRYGVLLGALLAAAGIDLRTRRIPDPLVRCTAAVGILLAVFDGLMAHLLAGVSAAGLAWLMRGLGRVLFGRAGMGMGDVKMAGAMGLLAGWPALWMLYLAMLIGGSWAGVGLVGGWLSRETHVPFAPFLVIGALAGIALPFSSWWGV